MSRRSFVLAVLFVSMLAAAPAAAGDGPMPGAMQGGAGLLLSAGGPGGGTRLVAVGTQTQPQPSTTLEVVSTKDGFVQRWADYWGEWGIPTVTGYSGTGEGLSADGKTVVLGDIANTYPRTKSSFLVIDRSNLLIRRAIQLKGDFAYDAISPNGHRLYLIQHVDANDTTKYVVRGYDLETGTLLPGRIADRTQKGWVMAGYPQARVISPSGRWVYTLYQPAMPGSFPFIHALDTVRGVAHCVGLPWPNANATMNGFYNMRLSLRSGGDTLAVHWLSGRPWLTVNTGNWRISADHGAAFPWAWVAGGLMGAGALAGIGAVLLRRRRREEFEQELVDLFGAAEHEVMV
jgi:hypothetical protein